MEDDIQNSFIQHQMVNLMNVFTDMTELKPYIISKHTYKF